AKSALPMAKNKTEDSTISTPFIQTPLAALLESFVTKYFWITVWSAMYGTNPPPIQYEMATNTVISVRFTSQLTKSNFPKSRFAAIMSPIPPSNFNTTTPMLSTAASKNTATCNTSVQTTASIPPNVPYIVENRSEEHTSELQ